MTNLNTTPYSSIYDLFMMEINDYRLVELYSSQLTHENFFNYVEGFLIKSIVDFKRCDQNLSDRNDTAQIFNFIMTDTNKVILSILMAKHWLNREVQNVLQMNTKLQDKDFHTYAESTALTAKQNLYTLQLEQCDLKLTQYGYDRVNWDGWLNQSFMVL